MTNNNTFFIVFTLIAILATVVQLVGIATPNWFVLNVNSTSVHTGLFQVCVEGTACVSYFSYVGVNLNYYCYVTLGIFGLLLLFVAVLISLASYKGTTPKATLNKIGILACVGGACIVTGVIWFAVTVSNNASTVSDHLKIDINFRLGYSMYLCAVSGSIAIVTGLVGCIRSANMPRDHRGSVISTTDGYPMVLVSNLYEFHQDKDHQQEYNQENIIY